MKFLCDQMLARLGRWLRAAGYDTVIIEEQCADEDIFHRAMAEERLLITRDQHFLDFEGAAPVVLWLDANDLEGCVRELNQRVEINWMKDPFSRCLICNEELVDADPVMIKEAPSSVQERCRKFWECPRCHKLFWEGSHTQHMLERLRSWQR